MRQQFERRTLLTLDCRGIVNPANPASATLRAALEGSEPHGEVEIEGRRWLVERAPEPGVEVRLTSVGPPPVATTQHFSATSSPPPSYPAWLPFIPGRPVSVSVWGSPQCASVAWTSLEDPAPLLGDLLHAMERQGWPPGEVPRPGQVGFMSRENGDRKRVVVSSGSGGEWVVVLSDYPARIGDLPQ